jgi:AraC family transcriptional regulator
MSFIGGPVTSHCDSCGAVSTRRDGVSTQASTVFQPHGGRAEPHAHDTARLIVSLHGRYDERSGSRTSDIRAGSAFFRPAGDVHTNEYIYDDVRYISIAIPSALLATHDLFRARVFAAPFAVSGRAVASLGSQLAAEVCSLDAAAPIALEGLVLELLAQVSLPNVARGRMPRWIATARDIIDAHHEAATPGTIARELDLDPSYVARMFRAHVGRSLGACIRQARIIKAVRKLSSEPQASIAQVALDAGFFDQSHFNRVFKQVVGVTPLRYSAFGRAARRSLQKSKSS